MCVCVCVNKEFLFAFKCIVKLNSKYFIGSQLQESVDLFFCNRVFCEMFALILLVVQYLVSYLFLGNNGRNCSEHKDYEVHRKKMSLLRRNM